MAPPGTSHSPHPNRDWQAKYEADVARSSAHELAVERARARSLLPPLGADVLGGAGLAQFCWLISIVVAPRNDGSGPEFVDGEVDPG
jgi:hypothetical protein